MSILNAPYFHDEAAAFAKLESVLWPEGPVCPKCGNGERIYSLEGVRSKSSKKNPEGVVRHGLKKCGKCRQQFTVRVGTVFESSHIALHHWLQAVYLLCCSKKGISSHQLHRILEIKYQSAWFMTHRIREAMRDGGLAPMDGGSEGGPVVEVDETFFGMKKGARKNHGYQHKNAVLSLVERGGQVRSFHIDAATQANILPIVQANIQAESTVHTDEARYYSELKNEYTHETVSHKDDEYVRGNVTTNSIEGYFSIFKRGMKGVYQHCSEKHLHRYLAEFDFRYNNRIKLGVDDEQRTVRALKGIAGKRLTYERSDRKEVD